MKLLVLLSRVPYPVEKGDKLRAFHQIRCLSKDHEITLCALSEGDPHPEALSVLGQYCRNIHLIPISKFGMIMNVLKVLFNGKPFQIGYFYRSGARGKIRRLIREIKPDHIYCQLIRMSEYVMDVPVKKTLDYQDVFSMGMKRRLAKVAWWKKPVFLIEYRRLLKYEQQVFTRFDGRTIISAPDRELIPHPLRHKVVIVPNGVDHEYFTPGVASKSYDLVFTGNMGYPPNVDAAEYLIREIFPMVKKEIPGVRLLIAGATPHPRLKALQSEEITVSGWMPDIRESYAVSRVFIAPMQIGTGLQNKLLEAMAMKLPCITSPLANSALKAAENKEILVAESAEEYTGHILNLLRNPLLSQAIAEAGHAFVINNYSWERTTGLLHNLIQSLAIQQDKL